MKKYLVILLALLILVVGMSHVTFAFSFSDINPANIIDDAVGGVLDDIQSNIPGRDSIPIRRPDEVIILPHDTITILEDMFGGDPTSPEFPTPENILDAIEPFLPADLGGGDAGAAGAGALLGLGAAGSFDAGAGGLTSLVLTPFGGQMLYSFQCTCSTGVYTVTHDYTTGSVLALVYEPFVTQVWTGNYPIYSGSYNLGFYTSQNYCYMNATIGCYQLPAYGTITHIGSSGLGV